LSGGSAGGSEGRNGCAGDANYATARDERPILMGEESMCLETVDDKKLSVDLLRHTLNNELLIPIPTTLPKT
jgi:hypothetical protein